jgi:hypothetical protein
MLWPTVSRPIRLAIGHPFGADDQIFLFPFFYRTIALLFVLGRPLWREDGSVIFSAICQWSESRRTHNHTLLSHLRLLGFLPFASYDSQGLRWKYSNPPPYGDYDAQHGLCTSAVEYKSVACTLKVKLISRYEVCSVPSRGYQAFVFCRQPWKSCRSVPYDTREWTWGFSAVPRFSSRLLSRVKTAAW